MKKILTISLALVLLCLTIVSAVPPQASEAELGYELRIPQVEFLMRERSVSSHIHIFNVSNGVPIYPAGSSVDCILHLYNQTGNHVLEQTMDVDANGQEWELFIDGGNFTELGEMSFIIYCNDSSAGGFVSNSFEVTETGQTPKEGIVVIFFSLLFIIFCFEMLGLLLFTILHLLELNLDAKDLIINVSSYFALFAVYILQIRFVGDKFMSDFTLFLIEVGAVTLVIIPIIGFVISYIKQNMKAGDHN